MCDIKHLSYRVILIDLVSKLGFVKIENNNLFCVVVIKKLLFLISRPDFGGNAGAGENIF
jgi:hypothetical protein